MRTRRVAPAGDEDESSELAVGGTMASEGEESRPATSTAKSYEPHKRIAELERRIRELEGQLKAKGAKALSVSGTSACSAPSLRSVSCGASPAGVAAGAAPGNAAEASSVFDSWVRSKLEENDLGSENFEHYMAWRGQITDAIGDAIVAVCSEPPIEPIRQLGHALIYREIPDIHVQLPHLENVLDPDKPAEYDRELRGLLVPIIESVKKRREEEESEKDDPCTPSVRSGTASGATTPRTTEADDLRNGLSHSTASWLESVGVKEIVESALLEPLKEFVEGDRGMEMSGLLEMEYLDSLAEKDDEVSLITIG